MARLIKPVLFSQEFGLDPLALEKENLLDPILNADTKLFIDPLLLRGSDNAKIKADGFDMLKARFEEIIRLVAASRSVGDKAWRTAMDKLNLYERSETGLGYGGASTSGSSRPTSLKKTILETAKEIIELGERDPQIISLMGLFEEGVGPDTISDLTTNTILPILCRITSDFGSKHELPMRHFVSYGDFSLPENPYNPGRPVILVPRDILRDLPLAADWSDVSRVVNEIAGIRDAFNTLIGPITKATLSQKKRALRRAALASLGQFKKIFRGILNASDSYDTKADALNYYAIRRLLTSDLKMFSGRIEPENKKDKDELIRIVRDIIEHFKGLVENNNLWEMLWVKTVPKKERAAQLLFFAVADVFCRANGIDISPETHSGGGPVDFKFSSGYHNRVLVEVKRSMGTVVHGYEHQLETYKSAARTDAAFFLVIDLGGIGNKLREIQGIQEKSRRLGNPTSEIVVVNAKRRRSASKADDTDVDDDD